VRRGAVLAKLLTCAVVGLEGELVQLINRATSGPLNGASNSAMTDCFVQVEVDIARQGLVQFNIVGLPDAAVQEALERVRAAVRNSGLLFPYTGLTAGFQLPRIPGLATRTKPRA
jgi:magnesium chelatase family protein